MNTKNLFFTLLLITGISQSLVAQTFNYVTETEYNSLKMNGQLTGNEVIQSEGMVTVDPSDIFQEFIITPKAQGCGGYFDPPGPSMAVTSSDDGWLSASPIALPFTFCFFGDNYTQVWMNNNGNISFNGGISAFSSTAFPSNGNEMIAAFWADFDLGGAGTMHATITPTAAVFNWVGAGYYSDQLDKLNTCQIVITDGVDPLVQGGNVAIHYDDMQWTTGGASGGTNGFGGTPATAGANRGNNIDFFQIGQFDHEGTDYDGPNGVTDGVSWLDDKSFYFDFCTVGNIAPIPLETQYCDTFKVCSVGDTITLTFPFLSPEATQTTTVTYSAPTLNNVNTVSSTAGSTGELVLEVYGAQESIGYHTITVTATDDYIPAGVTSVTYTLEVTDASLAYPVDPVLDFTTQCAPMTFSVLNGPFDGYVWETMETTPTIDINNYFSETLTVTVDLGGCKFTIDSVVYVPSEPVFNLTGNLVYCEGQTGTDLEIPDSTRMGSITWGLSNPALDTLFSNNLPAGVYTLTAWDSLNICSNDTTFTVTEIPAPTIGPDTVGCNLAVQINGTTSAGGGVWSIADTAIHFIPNATAENPYIYTSTPGFYNLTYTDNICNLPLTMQIEFPPYAWTEIQDTILCEGVVYDLQAEVDPVTTSWTWSTGESGSLIQVTSPGMYYVTASNKCHSMVDSAYIGFKKCDIITPNVISLSSTVGNERWFVESDGISSFNCVILNRWGNVVYEFDDPNGYWDGTFKGKKVDEGTYFYFIDSVLEGGQELQKQGFIQVIH